MEKTVITISRGFGSGGKAVALMLSEKLGIPCYDKEILQMAADESGINEGFFFEADEKPKASYSRLFGKLPRKGAYKDYTFSPENRKFISDQNLYNFQAAVIRHLAATESCVIVGRASNYILKDNPDAVRINIQAPLDMCVAETMKRMQLHTDEARDMVLKSDRYRADFYKYYTGNDWKDPAEYDLSINTGTMSREDAVNLIISMIGMKKQG